MDQKQYMDYIYNDKNLSLLDNLKQRWMDEKEYEDWSDYENVLKKSLPEECQKDFIKGTKRPFGFIASVDKNRKVKISIKYKGNKITITAQEYI